MSNLNKIVEAARDGNAVELEKLVAEELHTRAVTAIEARRADIVTTSLGFAAFNKEAK